MRRICSPRRVFFFYFFFFFVFLLCSFASEDVRIKSDTSTETDKSLSIKSVVSFSFDDVRCFLLWFTETDLRC